MSELVPKTRCSTCLYFDPTTVMDGGEVTLYKCIKINSCMPPQTMALIHVGGIDTPNPDMFVLPNFNCALWRSRDGT